MENLGRQVHGTLPRRSRIAQVRARVLAALDVRAPLTILRGPRGYGKTTAIVHWLEQQQDDIATVYVPLDAEARLSVGFWTTLAAALTRAGLTLQTAADDDVLLAQRGAVLRALLDHDEPLRLVIDNYHEAGHLDGRAAVDDDVLDAVRGNRQLEVVVATRSVRTLETSGSLSVDVTVVRPADLALEGADVRALAGRRGLSMTEDEADRLVVELGGWPAAIRSCVDKAAVGGQVAAVDAALVDAYLEALLAEIRSAALRDFLLRTAVPEEFSAAGARVIVPDGNPIRELRGLRLAGFLRERETVAGLRYSYPPAIRDAFRRIVAEQRPEVEREVNLALMTLAAREEGPAGVLRHAAAAQEWDTALRIMDEEWVTLVTQYAGTLVNIAAQFPPEIIASEPRLRVARKHVPRMATSGEARWPTSDAHFIDAAVHQRWQEQQGTTDDVVVLVQSGAAAIFAGENAAAAYAFERVRDYGIAHDDRTAKMLGGGGLLMAKALSGQATLALRLAAEPELAEVLDGTEDDDVAVLLRVGGRMARVVADVDALSPLSHDDVAGIIEPQRRDELWALAVNARGLYASAFGTAEQQAQIIGELRAAMRHLEPGSITEATLGTQLAELLVITGMPDIAAQALDRLEDNYVTGSTRALVLHAQGRDREAIEAAERGLADERITERSRHLGVVVMSSALHRLGQATAARKSFLRAAGIAHESGQRRAFGLMDAGVFVALSAGDPAMLRLRPLPSTVSATAHQYRPVPAVDKPRADLSEREREVLTALQAHTGPAGVAAELGVSVNTVKTHLRHVYRKLGATSREEALLLGRTLVAEPR